MRRLLAVLVCVTVLAACGGTGTDPVDHAGAVDLFLVRPDGASGPLLAYDMPLGDPRFELPGGMLSADGERFAVVAPAGRLTELELYEPDSGDLVSRFSVEGTWELGAISPNGRWLALSRRPTEEKTQVEIVDATGGVMHVLELDGDFEIETVSADGKRLFLVEHLPDNRYRIRLYDLSREALVADPLRSKTGDEVMAGLAWNGVASPDGRWLLTLYLSTIRDHAFIHALDLEDSVPVCIDLPSRGGEFDALAQYSLALASNGLTVYAVNPALGVVAEVDLEGLQVVATTRFKPVPPADPTSSAVAPDGTLYFEGGSRVWRYDAHRGKVTEVLVKAAGPFLGLDVSDDGGWLYVARAGGDPIGLELVPAT